MDDINGLAERTRLLIEEIKNREPSPEKEIMLSNRKGLTGAEWRSSVRAIWWSYNMWNRPSTENDLYSQGMAEGLKFALVMLGEIES